MDAILNLDLDFFTEPAYVGENYLFQDFKSHSDFFSKAKQWLDINSFMKKMNVKKVRGQIVSDDKQVLFYYDKLFREKFIEPKKFTLIHVDAHHDMYDFFGWDYYDYLDLFGYQPFNSLIATIKKEWIKPPIYWVYPDYISKGSAMLDTSHIDFEIKKIPWSHFSQLVYTWRYATVVLNRHMAVNTTQIIEQLRPYISIW